MGKERTEAQRRAEARYKDAHCDRIAIMIPKGERDKWHEIARQRGYNLKSMIVQAVEDFKKNYPVIDKE